MTQYECHLLLMKGPALGHVGQNYLFVTYLFMYLLFIFYDFLLLLLITTIIKS